MYNNENRSKSLHNSRNTHTTMRTGATTTPPVSVSKKSHHNYSVMMMMPHTTTTINNGSEHRNRIISERQDLLGYEDGEYNYNAPKNRNNTQMHQQPNDLDFHLESSKEISNRLPLLQEVLNKQTHNPVDLWSFYTFISNYPQAINCLDFYIDITTHLRFCKEYVRDIRKSVRTFIDKEKHLMRSSKQRQPGSTSSSRNNNVPDHSRLSGSSKNTSSGSDDTVPSFLLFTDQENQEKFLGHYNDGINDSNIFSKQDITKLQRDSKRISAFLNEDLQSQLMSNVLKTWKVSSFVSSKDDLTNTALDAELQQHPNNNNNNNNNNNQEEGSEKQSKHSFQWDTGKEIDKFISDQGITTKLNLDKLLKNAESIVTTYITSSADSPKYLLNLPSNIRDDITQQVFNNKKFDPEIFETCKDITFQILEQDMFPIFLKEVVFHNLHENNYHNLQKRGFKTGEGASSSLFPKLSHFPQLNRMALGMIFLWIGLWVGYTLIFLNYSKKLRVVTLAPFLFAWYFIITGITRIDIIYAMCGITQTLNSSSIIPISNDDTASISGNNPQPNINEKSFRNSNSSHNMRQSSGSNNSRESFFANHSITNKESWNLLELGVFGSSSKTRNKNIPWFVRLIHGGKQDLAKIQSPFVENLIRKRSYKVIAYVLLLTAILTVIFSCVPGHRL